MEEGKRMGVETRKNERGGGGGTQEGLAREWRAGREQEKLRKME